MTIDKKVEELEKAIELVEEAQNIVDSIMKGNNGHYNSYGKYGFNQLLGNGNKYDSSLISVKHNLRMKRADEFLNSESEIKN